MRPFYDRPLRMRRRDNSLFTLLYRYVSVPNAGSEQKQCRDRKPPMASKGNKSFTTRLHPYVSVQTLVPQKDSVSSEQSGTSDVGWQFPALAANLRQFVSFLAYLPLVLGPWLENPMDTPKHHVLYIEDHDDTRELVTLVLSERNYRVTTGATIVEALKLAQEHDFDLYMLDSWLPDGSGIDLCRSLRAFDPGVPIMFFSGAAYEADKETAINSGAQAYITKPAHFDELYNEVSRLIRVFPRKPALMNATVKGADFGAIPAQVA